MSDSDVDDRTPLLNPVENSSNHGTFGGAGSSSRGSGSGASTSNNNHNRRHLDLYEIELILC